VNFQEPEDPRLTPFETIPKSYPDSRGGNGEPEKKELPTVKPTLFIVHQNGKGLVVHEYMADEVTDQVLQLVEAGIPFKSIKVLREIPLKLDVRLGVTR
jgi:hypothetical protein